MINYLYLRNFRAFKSQKFDLAKINVFVGANNSGKSSALSALNLLAQTITDNESGAPLVLRGKYDDLGTFIDIVHGNKPTTQIGIEIGIEKTLHRFDFKYRTKRKEIEIVNYEIRRDAQHLFSYHSTKDAYNLQYGGKSFETLLPRVAKRKPEFWGVWLIDPNMDALRTRSGAVSEKFANVPEDILKNLHDVQRSIWSSQRDLRTEFVEFSSLGSFREPPLRTFLFSGGSPTQVGRTGGNAIEMLVSDSLKRGSLRRELIEQVSAWLQATGMAKGIKVKSLTPRHFEVCVLGNDGSEHNICDVGFGVSQVLPVLVAGFHMFAHGDKVSSRSTAPTFVVQEPEIHLHPNAQAELATFFVGIEKLGGQLFIETHSDTLVIRLQQHVAKGDVAAKDVKIFYMLDRGGNKEVISLDVDDRGLFDKEWPGGFFPQRQKESLELARAVARNTSDESV
ncbi:MAG: DUF3696 domain-containing protein [Dongiaceae bacterium]